MAKTKEKSDPFDQALVEAQKIALTTLYIPESLRSQYKIIDTEYGAKLINVKESTVQKGQVQEQEE